MDTIIQIVRSIPTNFLAGLLFNGFFITLIYYLFWKKFKAKYKLFRIQIQQRFNDEQLKHELRHSITTLLVAATYSSIVIYFGTMGYTKVYLNFGDYNPLWGIFGFFIILLIDDAWFYWIHRLLHQPKLYKYVHSVHHESIDVNPFTSMSFHWIEAALLTFWIVPISLVLPIYAPVLGLVQIWGLFDNIKGHLGYEFFPNNFNKSILRFMTTSTHHNMHHSKFTGNYGVHFRFWDKLFGTEFKDYESEFETIQNRKKGILAEQSNIATGAVKAIVKIQFNGNHQVKILDNETVLDALIRKNFKVPYACKKGKCGTCKCQLLAGTVKMKKIEALNTEELNKGIILTCQSIPTTKSLEIKY